MYVSPESFALMQKLAALDAATVAELFASLHRDALTIAPPAQSSGVNEERERLRNESTYAERKRAKDRERQARIRELAKQSRDIDGDPAINRATSTATEGDQLATTGDPKPAHRARVVNTTSSLRSEAYPLSSPSESPPQSPKPRRSRKCPEDWSPEPAEFIRLTDAGFSPGEIERELSKFRNHEFGTPKSDWTGTFRNWLDRSREFQPRKAHDRADNHHQPTAREDRLGRMLRGAMAAVDERTSELG